MDLTLHGATSATAKIDRLGMSDIAPGLDLGSVLRIRVQRHGDLDEVKLIIFGEADELRAICAAIGAAAVVVHEPVGGAS